MFNNSKILFLLESTTPRAFLRPGKYFGAILICLIIIDG